MEGGPISTFFMLLVLIGGLIFGLRRRQQWSQSAVAAEKAMESYHLEIKEALLSGDSGRIMQSGRNLLEAARQHQPGSYGAVADRLYRSLLIALKDRPELRPFILNVGRAARGTIRPGGNPSIADEQAIANDIAAHE